LNNFSGQPDCRNDHADFLQQIGQCHRLRSSGNLHTLSRIREQLKQLTETATLNELVFIQLKDIAILRSQVMSRIRY